jgi:hypothetical protein
MIAAAILGAIVSVPFLLGYIDMASHGVAHAQVWTYPDQLGWFRVNYVSGGVAGLAPVSRMLHP